MSLEIIVPDDLNEITLKQYQKFAKVSQIEGNDESFIMQKMVEIFCGINLKNVLKIKFSSIQNVVSILTSAFEKQYDLKRTFVMDGVEYGFIPDLDEISLGEYIDLDKNFNDWDNMHKTMSILYRPIKIKKGSRYQIEEYNGTDEAVKMKEMPLDVVFGALVFFYNLERELLKITLSYLQKEAGANMTSLQKRVLDQSGDGISQSMLYQRAMFLNLTK